MKEFLPKSGVVSKMSRSNAFVSSRGPVVIKILTGGIAIAGLWGALHVVGTQTDVLASASQITAKGDRLDLQPIRAACGDWPYYHQACLSDLTNKNSPRRKIRIISQANHRRTSFLAFLRN
jgi:hypothetical protein